MPFIAAVLLGFGTAFNFYFKELRENKGKYFGWWLGRGVVYTIFIGLLNYFILPAYVSPFLAIYVWVLIMLGISLGIDWYRSNDADDGALGAGITIYLLIFLVFSITGMSGCAMFRAHDYHDMIGQVKEGDWSKDVPPIDVVHMRIVSKDQAKYLADKVLGDSKDVLGSKYSVGEVTVCKIKDELVWVAPIEFRGFWQWVKFKTVPGYVMVSAEEPGRKPVLVDNLKLKYVTSAFWGSNAKRYLYMRGYSDIILDDFTFELDDNYRPFYTVSVLKPSIGFAGYKVEGVVILDPEIGEIKFYKKNEVPAWVDRTVPEGVAETYMTDWGQYGNGFWNTVFSREGLIEPTQWPYGDDVWLILGSDSQPYWYTGVTSKSVQDQALIGVMLMHARTGQTYYYKISGSNEQAIYDAVNNKLGANSAKWVATMPIPYNIYGTLAYVVPVVGREQALLQKIAIVKADTLSVAIGDDKREAFNEYRMLLTKEGNKVSVSKEFAEQVLKSVVLRKSASELRNSGNINYFLWLQKAPIKLFEVNSNQFPEVKVTEPGDEVVVKFMMTTEEIVSATSFDNLMIILEKSPEQKSYEVQVDKAREVMQVLDKARELDKELEKMTPEEKAKILEQIKKKKD